MKNGASYRRCLVAACLTYGEVSNHRPTMFGITAWTNKAIRPSYLCKIVGAYLFTNNHFIKFSLIHGVYHKGKRYTYRLVESSEYPSKAIVITTISALLRLAISILFYAFNNVLKLITFTK